MFEQRPPTMTVDGHLNHQQQQQQQTQSLDGCVESQVFLLKKEDPLSRPCFVTSTSVIDDDDDEDIGVKLRRPSWSTNTLCGIGSWRPACLQRFANSGVFMVVFCVSMMFLGMPNAYFYAINSTIEKVFNMNSRMTGVILIGNDVSQVLFSIAIGYLGSKGSRPAWMALGLAMCAVSCFTYATNHSFWTPPSVTTATVNDGLEQKQQQQQQQQQDGSASDLCKTATGTIGSGFNGTSSMCPEEKPMNYLPAILFFVGQFAAGIGNTALMSLGISYGDDYSKKKNTPLMFGFMIISRMMGAFLGFVVAGICLRLYVVPGENPQFSQRDPRWLGRWWLGFVGFGVCLIVCSFLMLLMPEKLPPKDQRSSSATTIDEDMKSSKLQQEAAEEFEQDISKMAIKDLIQTICRLLRNPVLVLGILSESVLMLYVGASQIYSSRYTEVQFRQTASKASFLTGIFNICVMMAFCMAGSILFARLKPDANRVSGLNAAIRFIQVSLIVAQMMLSCGKVDYANVRVGVGEFEVTSSCSRMCECGDSFQPVCVGNITYLSPCHAGCSEYKTEGSKKIFSECACASPVASHMDFVDQPRLNTSSMLPTAISGICASETCSAMKYYLALASFINLLAATLYPACATVLIRCVRRSDKSMAMALKTVGFCLIGFFPGPILYGFVFDSACILRESAKCTGDQGNCWVYDVDILRLRFLGTSATVVCISAVLSFVMYLQVRKTKIILFDPEEDVDTKGFNKDVDKEMKSLNEY